MSKNAPVVKRGNVVAIGHNVGQDAFAARLGDLSIVPLKQPKKKEATAPAALPDLDIIQVVTENPEQIAQRIEEAKQMRAYAQKAAGLVATIRDRRAQIFAIKRETEVLTPALQLELEELERNEKRILDAGGNVDMQERIEFGLLMEDIKRMPTDETAAQQLLDRCVKMGRFKVASAKEAAQVTFATREPFVGPQRLGNIAYIPCFNSREDKGQFALEAELGKRLANVNAKLLRKRMASIYALIDGGDKNLEHLNKGIEGAYVLQEYNGKGGALVGTAIVSIGQEEMSSRSTTVITIIDGAGTLAWMREEKGFWIPFGAYKRGMSGDKVAPKIQEVSNRLIATIATSCKTWKASSAQCEPRR